MYSLQTNATGFCLFFTKSSILWIYGWFYRWLRIYFNIVNKLCLPSFYSGKGSVLELLEIHWYLLSDPAHVAQQRIQRPVPGLEFRVSSVAHCPYITHYTESLVGKQKVYLCLCVFILSEEDEMLSVWLQELKQSAGPQCPGCCVHLRARQMVAV